MLAYTGAGPGARALEIGAGTGQATAQFAWRDLRVHVLEPSAEMAALIVEKFEDSGLEVTIEVAGLESAQLEADSFDLVFAATSWHWLEPETRWRLVSRTLRPGGAVAAFWNWPHWRETELREELDGAYERSGASLQELAPMMIDLQLDAAALAREWLADAPDPEAFTDTRLATYRWSMLCSSTEYVGLLGTYADHLALDADVRERLFRDIIGLIDAHGGAITLRHSTQLLVARAR